VGKVKFAWYDGEKFNFECASAPAEWDGKILISWDDFLNRNGRVVEIRNSNCGRIYLDAGMVLIFTKQKLNRDVLEAMGCEFD